MNNETLRQPTTTIMENIRYLLQKQHFIIGSKKVMRYALVVFLFNKVSNILR